MTKIIAALSAVLLALAGIAVWPANQQPVITQEETYEEIVEMTGTVADITDTYYLIENTDGQQVQVNLYDETIFEGKTPEKGDLIHILYNGMMTRSLPPQINAQRIGCYVLTGAVVELTEEGFTLDVGNDIFMVHAGAELLQGIETGSTVTVYFNGAMTMSIPAQVGAEMILITASVAD